jgi:hypothetical protein
LSLGSRAGRDIPALTSLTFVAKPTLRLNEGIGLAFEKRQL